MHKHPDDTDGAMSEHGALARRNYGLLAPEYPTVYPAVTEPQDYGDGPEATMGTGGPYEREIQKGEQNWKRAILVCGHWRTPTWRDNPPNGSARLTRAATKGGKGADPSPSSARFPYVDRGGRGKP